MDFVRSYFGKNEPLTSSEVHLYRSNFLQNPYFSICPTNQLLKLDLMLNLLF